MSAPPLDQVDLDEVNAIASGVYVNEKNRIKSAILVSGSNGKVDEVKAKKKHISELPMTFSNWPQHVNWLNRYYCRHHPPYRHLSDSLTPLSLKTAIWPFTLTYFLTQSWYHCRIPPSVGSQSLQCCSPPPRFLLLSSLLALVPLRVPSSWWS